MGAQRVYVVATSHSVTDCVTALTPSSNGILEIFPLRFSLMFQATIGWNTASNRTTFELMTAFRMGGVDGGSAILPTCRILI